MLRDLPELTGLVTERSGLSHASFKSPYLNHFAGILNSFKTLSKSLLRCEHIPWNSDSLPSSRVVAISDSKTPGLPESTGSHGPGAQSGEGMS